MIHQDSVASRQTRFRSINPAQASLLDPLFDSRIRRNRDEFRGVLRNEYVQTNALPVVGISSPVDEAVQVNEYQQQLDFLENDILAMRSNMAKERSRYLERERFLIAQMNAIRENPHSATVVDSEVLTVSVMTTGGSIEPYGLQPAYDRLCVEYRITQLEAKYDSILSLAVSKESYRYSDGRVEWSTIPTILHLSKSVGQIVISCLVIVKSSGESVFPMLLADWTSAPFIPALKQRNGVETVHAILEKGGHISLDLVINEVGS